MCLLVAPQLPDSYYFITCILVLKFVNKGLFVEEIQDSHFSRKGCILVLTSMNLEKKGLFFMSSVLPWKGGSLGLKSQIFTAKKEVHFGLKSQCFITKKGSFWAEKSVYYHKKRGAFSNWRTRMGTIFSSEWGSRGLHMLKAHSPRYKEHCIWRLAWSK